MRTPALYILGLAFLFLVSCSRPGEDRTVTFMISGDPEELRAYETLLADFRAVRPEILVSLIHVPGGKEFREKLSTMFSANTPPDVFLYNYRRLGDYAQAGAVRPLGDLLEAGSELDGQDFYPVTLAAFTYKGELQCIPQNLSSPVIYFNKALFDEARLPYPQPGWSYDQFVENALDLTRDRDGDGQTDQWGFGTEVETIRLAPFLWQRGGDFFDDPANPTRLVLDEPAGRAALRWFLDLQLVHRVAPDIVAETAQNSEDRFLNGGLAMYMSSRVSVPALRTITAFEWDAAPLPGGDSPVSVLHSDGFCMSAHAGREPTHAADVLAFIRYSVSEKGQQVLAGTGRTVPSIAGVAESEAFLGSFPPASNRVWLEAAGNMRALPMLPGWTTFEELFSRELQRAYYGDSDLEELLEKAAGLAAPLLAGP